MLGALLLLLLGLPCDGQLACCRPGDLGACWSITTASECATPLAWCTGDGCGWVLPLEDDGLRCCPVVGGVVEPAGCSAILGHVPVFGGLVACEAGHVPTRCDAWIELVGGSACDA